tara:strand:+ start:41 stop:982 length:942 start_codon:yes stop_codon:yes gene_type:complete
MKILVTGCAGFIGSHVSEFFLKQNHEVFGIDNINDYYDVSKKQHNLTLLQQYPNFQFKKDDICSTTIIEDWKPDKICHLASMAGVRYSIQNPEIYVQVNIQGFIHLLEQAVKHNIKDFVYASSSSVYGLNKKVPFSETDTIDTCNSPYACSKRCMEIFANTYNRLYGIRMIGLRFFTVYGPRGRPDMAPYIFLKAIHTQTPFTKYGSGDTSRDYTYIDDIVAGIVSAVENKKNIQCGVFNLGNSSPVSLQTFIETCEKVVGKQAIYTQIEQQLGDVPHTYADISSAQRELEYQPQISLEQGLTKTYAWLRTQY